MSTTHQQNRTKCKTCNVFMLKCVDDPSDDAKHIYFNAKNIYCGLRQLPTVQTKKEIAVFLDAKHSIDLSLFYDDYHYYPMKKLTPYYCVACKAVNIYHTECNEICYIGMTAIWDVDLDDSDDGSDKSDVFNVDYSVLGDKEYNVADKDGLTGPDGGLDFALHCTKCAAVHYLTDK